MHHSEHPLDDLAQRASKYENVLATELEDVAAVGSIAVHGSKVEAGPQVGVFDALACDRGVPAVFIAELLDGCGHLLRCTAWHVATGNR